MLIKPVFSGPSNSGLAEIQEQKLQAALGLLNPSKVPAAVMPELQPHIRNFPDIESSLQDLQCGLLSLLDVGAKLSSGPEYRQLLADAQFAFHRVSEAREDLSSFARPPGADSLLELPIDLAQFRQVLQEKSAYQNPKEHIENVGAEVKRLCGVVSRSLEYVIDVYERDLASFACTSAKSNAVIQERGQERIAATKLALSAISTLVDRLSSLSRPGSQERDDTTQQAGRRQKASLP